MIDVISVGLGLSEYGLLPGVGEQDQRMMDVFQNKVFLAGCMRHCGIQQIEFTGSYTDKEGRTYTGGVKIVGADTENSENQDNISAAENDDKADPRDHDYE